MTASAIKLGMPINYAGDFRETIDNLVDFESAGVARIAVPEAYSFDAVSQLGYIAARTEKMELQSGILPMYSRTPSTSSPVTSIAQMASSVINDTPFAVPVTFQPNAP